MPQILVEVDREKAIALGVPVGDIFDALQATMGALYVNDFNKFGRTYRVQVQAEGAFRAKPEDLGNVYVRSAGGDMLPLKSLLTITQVVGPEQIDRYLDMMFGDGPDWTVGPIPTEGNSADVGEALAEFGAAR